MNQWCSLESELPGYYRQAGPAAFDFITAVWIDTASGDEHFDRSPDNYVVCADTVENDSLEGAEEAFFESLSDGNCISEVVTLEEAKRIVEAYIHQ